MAAAGRWEPYELRGSRTVLGARWGEIPPRARFPLYIFCGRHLLAAKLRRSNIDASAGAVEEIARIIAQIRHRWPKTRILLGGDSGFAREALMAWCETNRVDFLFAWCQATRQTAPLTT